MLRITQWAKEQEFFSRQYIDQTTLLPVFFLPLLHAGTAPNRLGLELAVHCNDEVKNMVVLAEQKQENQNYFSPGLVKIFQETGLVPCALFEAVVLGEP